ncbi:MAG: CBS domain-containing protein [Leptolyngbya sp. DLM2.Bin15]|nr:MAG: CBS domain-containing protein [Leptolyngbya sp. DLM2.Bin15]
MMQVQDIMTPEVVTIRGSASVAEAVQLMKEKGLRALVVEPRSELDPFGTVTESDIVYKVAAFGHDPKKVRVYEIMTKPCITVYPELGVEYLARLFAQSRIRRSPVVQGTKILGIVSLSDILCKSDFTEAPKQLFLEDRIEAARDEARTICRDQGDTSPACATAWDIVEELQAATAHQREPEKTKSSLQSYCEANPDAEECRIYED